MLLVVAPSLRIETLWPEPKRRVRAGMGVEPGDDQVTTRWGSDIRRATVGTGPILILASWRALLRASESSVGVGDGQAVNDIRQLSGLADLQDSREPFLPLRPEQLDLKSHSWFGTCTDLSRMMHACSASGFGRWEGFSVLAGPRILPVHKAGWMSRVVRSPLRTMVQTRANLSLAWLPDAGAAGRYTSKAGAAPGREPARVALDG